VCSENLAVSFRGPLETPLDILVSFAISSDGAAAVIVGADPDTAIECPLFQLVSAEQCIVNDGIVGHTREIGMAYYLHQNVPSTVAKGAAGCLEETFSTRYGIKDWNSLFYSVHPGGPGVLNKFEQ
jgi:chalcone synthase